MTRAELIEKLDDPLGPDHRCRDYDDECPEVENHLHCWLHDPTLGWCPYLKAQEKVAEDGK